MTITDLFEKHQSVQTVGFTAEAYKPGLERIETLDAVLGKPWTEYKTIHVAGTNGKGSVSSMLASVLDASGLKVGLFTSPHLLDFRERIRIVGEGMIPQEDVQSFLDEYEKELEPLSFFEITTAMAFKWFADRGVDIAVIEAGLGGRLDSTNIITPCLSVITSIGLDHCALLGDTREKIAFEKAGIFKPDVKAVVASYDSETGPVFQKKAKETDNIVLFAEDLMTAYDEDEILERMDLKGPCQKMNLHTVLVCLSVLGVDADVDALKHTAERTALRGRWEQLCSNPETICDIAHNPPALELNFKRLEESGKELHIVYGVMADKDLNAIVPLMPRNAKYYLCAPGTDRAMSVPELKKRIQALRPELDCVPAKSVKEAVKLAKSAAVGNPNSLVYIGGSTFVVSEAL